MITFWIVALIAFLIIEGATFGLTTIWFAFGSLAALLVAALGGKLWLQITLFLLVSVLMLVLLRPIAKKYLTPRQKATNADRILGMTGVVTETIDNIKGSGAAKISGKVWTARSADGSVIPEGALVKPLQIEGVKLIVINVQEEQE